MDEFSRSAVDFSKRFVKLEAQCKRLKEENNNLTQEVMDAKGKTEEMKEKYTKLRDKFVKRKEKFDSEERKWREEEERLTEAGRQLEREKKKIEDNLRASAAEALRCVAKKLREVEAEAEAMKSLMEEKDAKIALLLMKNESLERCTSRLEIDFEAKMATRCKLEEEKILELTQKVQVLEGEKRQLEAEFRKVKEDNRSKDEKICVLERVKEAEKRAIEDEGKEKVSELHHRIDVLESEKKEVEEKFSLFVEKSEEISGIGNQRMATIAAKTTLEAESKQYVLELIQRIEVLEREKTELEVEVSQAKTGKRSEEIVSILKEKHKEISNLVFKSDVLESRKHRLEVQNREGDERIKELVKEKECLVRMKKKMEIETNSCGVKSNLDVELPQSVHPDASNIDITNTTTTQNEVSSPSPSPSPSTSSPYKKMEIGTNICVLMSMDDVELPQLVHLDTSNAGIIGTPPTRNEAPEHIDVSDAEPKESSGLLGSKITKRKVQVLGCSVVNQAQTKYCKLDGLTERKTLQHGLEAQKEAEERIKMLVQEKEQLVGGVSSKNDVDLPQPVHPDTCNVDNTSTPTKQNRVSSPSPATSTSSRYENQKRRDWNSFGKYLKNHKPELALSSCSGHHVREYLLYLDQFGKTKVHVPDCPFYGHPKPPDPCPCPIRQGWGSLDALTGRLRAAFEENGGKPEDNPFGTLIVRRYLLDVKDSQSKARGVSYMKKRKNPRNAANYHMPLGPPPASGAC